MRLVHLITCWLLFIGLALSQQDTSTSSTCIPPGPALNSQRPDFAACLVQIDNLTVSQRSNSGCFENANTGVLTFSGCELMCGSSYSLWVCPLSRCWLLGNPLKAYADSTYRNGKIQSTGCRCWFFQPLCSSHILHFLPLAGGIIWLSPFTPWGIPSAV